ncbi:hypothetical protein FB475_4870 [Kribbella jejuensis]|uniref:Uncharacterized protein n=1 Tax=Kribbella jejuensis TaxID=236068 RepID=A0A542E9D1_9ACTN|nr:hypothetical protein FB475_4870 [Kribbella jejuensis]
MGPYLAAVRNYWSLLPAVLVIVGLILVYAVPTIINPQWTSSIMALFRTAPLPGDPTPEEARRAAGILGPQQLRSRRMLAIAMVIGAIALIGFNIFSLNREAVGCYKAARAFGADDGPDTKDPCYEMIYGSFLGDGSREPLDAKGQPVEYYQLVKGKKPKYLQWIQNAPKYDDTDLVIGLRGKCSQDAVVQQLDDQIKVFIDSDVPCPPDSNISLLPIKLKKPLGDRKLVTVGGKEMTAINPDMDSWFTVVKKLATGG